MSQGSGSPVNFLDAETCDNILQDIRGVDGKLPDFNSGESDPGSPPPALEPAVALDRATQTSPTPTQDQSTFVLMVRRSDVEKSVAHQCIQALHPQLVAEGFTQTLPTWTREKSTQISQGPTCDRSTEMPTVTTTEAATQMVRAVLRDRGTDMPPVSTTTIGCQARTFFDNELIPPGAPRPKLPWAYTYAQFDQLLAAYPDVHPEDFVTFGILKEQPRRGFCREWGEVAGLLSHMISGRRSLVNELIIIINRIDRFDRDNPMRVTEEQALVAVLLRERRRSVVPLGDGAFALLAAPGGPMAPPCSTGHIRGPEGPPSLPTPSIVGAWTGASNITPAWALRDPRETSRKSRTFTGALSGPGWPTSSPARLRRLGQPDSRKRWMRRPRPLLPTSARTAAQRCRQTRRTTSSPTRA